MDPGADNAAMDGEMDDAMDDMEGMDPEDAAMDDEDDDGEGKDEYKRKELIARPWNSPYLEQTIKEVEEFSIKNTR